MKVLRYLILFLLVPVSEAVILYVNRSDRGQQTQSNSLVRNSPYHTGLAYANLLGFNSNNKNTSKSNDTSKDTNNKQQQAAEPSTLESKCYIHTKSATNAHIDQVRRISYNQKVPKGWRILNMAEGMEFIQYLLPHIAPNDIIAFSNGRLSGTPPNLNFKGSPSLNCTAKLIVPV